MKDLLLKISVVTEKLERFLIMTAILVMMANSTANAHWAVCVQQEFILF